MTRSSISGTRLSHLALRATLHCLTGCAVGEVLGMVLGTAAGWGNGPTVALAIVLAFAFGYSFTLLPLLRAGMAPATALKLALAADTASIALMETVDNGLMWLIPGAMDAPLASPHFWGSMLVSLAVAGVAAYPLNRWLLSRGGGHAHVHAPHGAHAASDRGGTERHVPAHGHGPSPH